MAVVSVRIVTALVLVAATVEVAGRELVGTNGVDVSGTVDCTVMIAAEANKLEVVAVPVVVRYAVEEVAVVS